MITSRSVKSGVSLPAATARVWALAVTLALAACGGGGSGDDTASSEDNDLSTPPAATAGALTLVAANDLGMHCADLDYQVFSILPPFNVVHAQVIQKGTAGSAPRILDGGAVTVRYAAASNRADPAGADSVNTSSQNLPGVFKSNFWAPGGEPLPAGSPGAGNDYSLGGLSYAALYPNAALAGALLDPSLDLSGLCADPTTSRDCPSALALFEPLPVDTGLPVPDVARFWPENGAPVAELFQQAMPGLDNSPQTFGRFDHELPFFVDFPFGARLHNLNWFAADGIPILPVDDAGRSNAYPLMRVTAVANAGQEQLASLDIVLPVASEADCQNCHADPLDCHDPQLPPQLLSDQCNGSALSQTPFVVATLADAPGASAEQQLLNAAKTNILRLHDAKHGQAYRNWDGAGQLVPMPCDATADATDPDCLANQTPLQCARCHYTPALDLLQTGPLDEPEQGLRGRQQSWHISMSRAMHGHHGSLPPFQGQPLFPPMPSPQGRDPLLAEQVLEQTCYQCHPGKRTRCLRGAMFAGGVVCQDCHGDMQQVGNDFTLRVDSSNPGDFVLDGSLRVPWASEPGCQSCHTGDASQPNHPAGAIVADDGIRLLQAFSTRQITLPGVAGSIRVADMIRSPASRFAENQALNSSGETVDVLYRLSTGHGGVMCEGCHNSTHAIWPNPNPAANDNIAAQQLQGHSGTLIECSACHAAGSLGLTLSGPHGMHPVNDARWNRGHEDIAENNLERCKACHGQQLEGTVLSRMAATRTLQCDDEASACGADGRITLVRGEPVSCDLCHGNPLFDD